MVGGTKMAAPQLDLRTSWTCGYGISLKIMHFIGWCYTTGIQIPILRKSLEGQFSRVDSGPTNLSIIDFGKKLYFSVIQCGELKDCFASEFLSCRKK